MTGSAGARLEVPAESLQAQVGRPGRPLGLWGPAGPQGSQGPGEGGSRELQEVRQKLVRFPARAWQSLQGWEEDVEPYGEEWGQPTAPCCLHRARGLSQARLWLPGLAELPEAPGTFILLGIHTLLPCWTPLGLFQAPGEDTIRLARQGYGPRPLGPPCPGSLALHAVVTHAHHQATSHLRAGWPARILLSQPPLQGDPHVGDHCAGATGPLLPGPKPAFCQLLPHPEGGNQSYTAILTLPRGPYHSPASRRTILLWARSQNPTLPDDCAKGPPLRSKGRDNRG